MFVRRLYSASATFKPTFAAAPSTIRTFCTARSDEKGKKFGVREIVDFLRRERARDIVCARAASDGGGDYLIVCSPFSARHMNAVVENLLKEHKFLRVVNDQGEEKDDEQLTGQTKRLPDWRVIALGRVTVHVMMADARRRYDLEQLWGVGADLDEQCLLGATADLDREIADASSARRRRLATVDSD